MLARKRGQLEGKAVGVLVLAIALFIALFVLFLPPEDRAELLDQDYNDDDTSSGDLVELLSERPGFISPLKEFATKHEVPDINLFVKTEPSTISLANRLEVTKGIVGGSSPITLSFDVQDISNIKDASLAFAANDPKGTLNIKLNGHSVESVPDEAGIHIIVLPINFLKQEDNKLELSASNPGIAFWTKNSFTLSEVSLKLEFERINAQESRDILLTQQEKESLELAKLKYFMVCNSKEMLTRGTTPLSILLNGKRIFSTQTSCVSTTRQHDIDPEDLEAGNNDLTFSIEEGDFSFNQVILETQGDDKDRPSFSFFLNQGDYEDIKSGRDNLKVKLLLEEDNKAKNARIIINDVEYLMKTDNNEFTKSIRTAAERGTNFVQLVPGNEFNVIGLKIFIER